MASLPTYELSEDQPVESKSSKVNLSPELTKLILDFKLARAFLASQRHFYTTFQRADKFVNLEGIEISLKNPEMIIQSLKDVLRPLKEYFNLAIQIEKQEKGTILLPTNISKYDDQLTELINNPNKIFQGADLKTTLENLILLFNARIKKLREDFLKIGEVWTAYLKVKKIRPADFKTTNEYLAVENSLSSVLSGDLDNLSLIREQMQLKQILSQITLLYSTYLLMIGLSGEIPSYTHQES